MLAAAVLAATMAPVAGERPVVERPIAAIAADLTAGRTTAAALVRAYRARIARLDRAGPRLRSVLALNPDALADARRSDAARTAGRASGMLAGVPILLKDNIESADPLPTTAGSLALANNVTGRDAGLVTRLRASGAIILGKTNLSEWANIRSPRSASGWSAVGGLTRNPYALDRSACGSSAGSAVAAAMSFAAAAIGTETDGSITCPAAANGVVGLKPTVGLVSRAGIVPISTSQDTAGPIARSVADAALLLGVVAGSDPADPATAAADAHCADYLAALDAHALRGHRIGVLRFAARFDPAVAALFDTALARMRAVGAILVEIPAFDRKGIGEAEHIVLIDEFRAGIDAYLAHAPAAVSTRSLADLIAFDRAHASTELRWFGQETFEEAAASRGLADPAYPAALAAARRLAGIEGIDRLLAEAGVEALAAPTAGPAWTSDLVNGDHYSGGGAGSLAAVAGYPHLTVPMGMIEGLPVGLSLIGPAWSEARLLGFGYAFEQAGPPRPPPTLARSVP